ncbi:MAG: hypothetical protein WBN18_13975 [Flavobacteriaceae bacterium]
MEAKGLPTARNAILGRGKRPDKLAYVFFGILFGVSLLAAEETSMAD